MQTENLQSCNAPLISIAANLALMTGFESDTQLIRDLCKFTKLAPSALATQAGLTPSTVLRYHRGTAETRISQPTLEKLRAKWPAFPGWKNELPDQTGMAGLQDDPNAKPDDVVYVRQLDIGLAMGAGTVIEDYPSGQMVPFNLGFIRALSKAATERLVIFTGQGESMEPTLLRSDILMFDTTDREVRMSDQIWAFTYAGGGMVKRLRRVRDDGRDRFLITSDNKEVPTQLADLEDVDVIGKLIWVGRRM